MPQDKQADRKARRLLVAAQKATAHKTPGSWVATYDVADSLGLNDINDAVRLAAAKGWLEVEGGHSVRLTAAGRRLATPYTSGTLQPL
jgi:hypothetical protein